MTKLAQMQRNFISDCLSGKISQKNTLMEKDIDSSIISAEGLMGIYQNSSIANILHSLTLTYPVIKKLVGEEFFSAMCRQFILVTWPKSGNMDDYGVNFPDFLAEFEHVKHLVYLVDVARLEWAFHRSSLADDAIVTDWSKLAQVKDILQLKFVLAPSLRLVSSNFPVDKIWQLNQEGVSLDVEVNFNDNEVNFNDNEVNFNDNEVNSYTFLTIFRQGFKTVIASVIPGEFALLKGFDEKQTFEQAINLATKEQVDFSVDGSLKKFIELGIISSWTITPV